jgi:hypothetical protein
VRLATTLGHFGSLILATSKVVDSYLFEPAGKTFIEGGRSKSLADSTIWISVAIRSERCLPEIFAY